MEQPSLIEGVNPTARREFDYYPTPAWMTLALLRRMNVFDVIEPCAGDGAISRVLKAKGARVMTNDLDTRWDTDWHHDATDVRFWDEVRILNWLPYWGVTNVPFDIADQIVPLAVQALPCFATILRLSWLEPTASRQRFLSKNPPRTVIVMPRHDFRGNGQTDSVTSAWFVWEQGYSSVTKGVQVVTKDERDELIAMNRVR